MDDNKVVKYIKCKTFCLMCDSRVEVLHPEYYYDYNVNVDGKCPKCGKIGIPHSSHTGREMAVYILKNRVRRQEDRIKNLEKIIFGDGK